VLNHLASEALAARTVVPFSTPKDLFVAETLACSVAGRSSSLVSLEPAQHLFRENSDVALSNLLTARSSFILLCLTSFFPVGYHQSILPGRYAARLWLKVPFLVVRRVITDAPPY